MKNVDEWRERFERIPYARRLGEIASSLAHLRFCIVRELTEGSCKELMQETHYYCEWTMPLTDADVQQMLKQVQNLISLWTAEWEDNWADDVKCARIAEVAEEWSQRLLQTSGLLEEKPIQPVGITHDAR